MGNDGLLLDDGDNQVLIDALQRVTGGWILFPPAELALVESASPPYDRMAAAMVTHNHGDHYSSASLTAFLAANPTAQFIAPTQVGLTANPQNAGVFPAFGTSQAVNINGVDIEVLHLRHFDQFGNDFSNVQNYGYLVHMGGKKFLHLGDVDYATDNFAPFNLTARDIDVVFIPQFNTLISQATRDVIENQIAPGQVVALHFQSTFVASESAQVLGFWPDAIIFDTALETVDF
jgi:L-ascorbate metabolism protein UlaG (beta-lactamase superfamily)